MDIVQVLKKEEATLQKQLTALRNAIAALNGGHAGARGQAAPTRKQMSAEARARISRATKLRWKKFRAEKAKTAKKN